MSFGMMVTRFAWMAHRLVSSKSPTKNSGALETEISLEVLGDLPDQALERELADSSSVLFWYLRISLSATVPGRNLCGFFTPPVAGADFLAALVASCFLGAFRRWTSWPSAWFSRHLGRRKILLQQRRGKVKV
ncbi:unnamed protein product [Spirodela intermedia]|uniref:Uncharacterized protein n=1 Tax=Spirodela intermedia TaxID=51605 RepID=A0A7I8J0W4_SPIIN|nr:unnamed protein product [Spirodela intermedia]CAA6663777.1 unnamed protein product [Spirodela intermedia]